MSEFESVGSWLEDLRELNAIIATTGEPLVGNLFYDHLQADYLCSPPNPILREKRDRFRRAIAGRASLLEVGVNGGHSAFLALTSNPQIKYHGVDICEHAYVKPAVDWLKRKFPGRVFLYEGDCRVVLPQLVRDGWGFDAFHIDGAKFTYFEDVRNCQRMVMGDGLVIVDDTQLPGVSRVLERCMRQGRIKPLSGFPSMTPSIKYRNAIGRLEPMPAWRTVIFDLFVPARRLKKRESVQRLAAEAPRLMRRHAARTASLLRHPVAVIRRRVRRGAVRP